MRTISNIARITDNSENYPTTTYSNTVQTYIQPSYDYDQNDYYEPDCNCCNRYNCYDCRDRCDCRGCCDDM